MSKTEIAERSNTKIRKYASAKPYIVRVPLKIQRRLEGHADTIDDANLRYRRVGARYIYIVGKELFDAHDLLAQHGPGGCFGAWVEQRFDISRKSAERAMKVYDFFRDCDTLSQFDITALYVLASADVPKEARKEAARLAARGAVITKKRANKIIDRIRQDRIESRTDLVEVEDVPTEDPPPKLDWQKDLERLQRAWEDAEGKARKEFRNWLAQRATIDTRKYDK